LVSPHPPCKHGIGGLLFDRFGFQAPILANLIGVTIALVAIIVAVKEPPRE